MRRVVSSGVLALILTLSVPALAAPAAHAGPGAPSAEQLTEAAARELSAELLDAAALVELVDTDGLARFTLGRHGRAVAPADMQRYTAALEGFLLRQADAHSGSYRGARIEVLDVIERKPGDRIVSARVSPPSGAPPRCGCACARAGTAPGASPAWKWRASGSPSSNAPGSAPCWAAAAASTPPSAPWAERIHSSSFARMASSSASVTSSSPRTKSITDPSFSSRSEKLAWI